MLRGAFGAPFATLFSACVRTIGTGFAFATAQAFGRRGAQKTAPNSMRGAFGAPSACRALRRQENATRKEAEQASDPTGMTSSGR